MLYIDSMAYNDTEDYHRYISSKNPEFIESAMSYIMEYLQKDIYKYKDFRFYNLKTNKMHILQKENFYGRTNS
jgi:hypothetical protein